MALLEAWALLSRIRERRHRGQRSDPEGYILHDLAVHRQKPAYSLSR